MGAKEAVISSRSYSRLQTQARLPSGSPHFCGCPLDREEVMPFNQVTKIDSRDLHVLILFWLGLATAVTPQLQPRWMVPWLLEESRGTDVKR